MIDQTIGMIDGCGSKHKPKAVWELIEGRERGVADLRHAHLLEGFGCKVLQTSNVDGALLGLIEVASTDAEVARGTHHAARQAQRIV